MKNLVWKLLRQHVCIPQLAGFFFANLFGMFIVMLSLQFYFDVSPVFSEEDGIIGSQYMIVSKRVTAFNALGAGQDCEFSEDEIKDLAGQPFCRSVGRFTASRYRVACRLGMQGATDIGTDMFFESVPDRYVDVDLGHWTFSPDNPIIPIVLPRTYLAIYNFGFAQSQSLPKLSESVVGMIDMTVVLQGSGMEQRVKGKVVGFSTRLNTILVPESFMQWSNAIFSPGSKAAPSRLILEVGNPTDDAIVKYLDNKGYELEDDKLEAGKTMYFLKVVSLIVMSIGLFISFLSFYILMLSIYLLVQKNTEKLRNLLLIGYSPTSVARPYQMLTVGINAGVFLMAALLLWRVRISYMDMLWEIFPKIDDGSMLPSLCAGGALFVSVGLMNAMAVRNRIMNIWNRKE